MSTDGVSSNTDVVLRKPPSDPNDILRDVGVTDFLTLMITELQNQDPLNPMDNAQMLQQLGEMQNISTSKRLADTLDSVLLGQNLASASGMIGKFVSALDDAGTEVSGYVDSVYIHEKQAKLVVGTSLVSLPNIRQIVAVE